MPRTSASSTRLSKEIDFGVSLRESPYRESPLGAVTRQALAIAELEGTVLRDYQPYVPSMLDPAAFIAAPVTRAGQRVGRAGHAGLHPGSEPRVDG